ncbi:MAG: hypothetical protein WC222_05680 [Parachlamydiales bacterium]|jgi:tetratricopeptide (TPR) repeat protein
MRKIILSIVLSCVFTSVTNIQAAETANKVSQPLPAISKLVREGKPEDAMNAVNTYIKAMPNDPKGYKVRGHLNFSQKKYNEALADFNQVIELKQKSATSFEDRAGTYLALKDYDRALADVDSALEIKPKSAFALVLKQAILEAKNPVIGPNFRVRNKGERLR